MTASRLPREMGTWIRCDGTANKGCPKNEKRFTANIVFEHNRLFVTKEGWGRGLRTGYKRRDLCHNCMPVERVLFKEQEAKKEANKRERAERKKAKLSSTPRPKKPRKPKSNAPTATASPSADFAQAPAT